MTAWRFEIFVDDGCPLCHREAAWLRWLDRRRGRLRITDVTAPGFAGGDHGLTFDEAMRSIHGRHPDGRIVHGVAVFRAAYAAVGLGWLWWPTRLPLLQQGADALYRVFARKRYERRMRQVCPLPDRSRAPGDAPSRISAGAGTSG